MTDRTPPPSPGRLSRHLTSWAPEPVTGHDDLSPGPTGALAATLDVTDSAPPSPGILPPLWHWLHFLEWPPQHELGTDGHPLHGHFLPPLPDRRRMIAGGRAEFHAPLRTGVRTQRHSSLGKVDVKHGSTGEMVFVTVRHELRQENVLHVVEEADFVYRSGEEGRSGTAFARDTTGRAEPPHEPWQSELCPEAPLLFRFSALTANAHRIHYDAPYACDTEGYPGLVVHGPLLVLLMLELARHNAPAQAVRSVGYRLRQPVFAGEHVRAVGAPDSGGKAGLRIATAREPRHATAEVTFA